MSDSLNNVVLAGVKTVDKPHLKGKPLYVATFTDDSGSQVDVELGLRQPDMTLYVAGERYDIETTKMYDTLRLKGIAPVGCTKVAPPVQRSSGGGGARGNKVFPLPLLHGDRSIVRQNALAHATKVVTELIVGRNSKAELNKLTCDVVASMIVTTARTFEAYSAGDAEREAAEQMREQEDAQTD